MEILEWDSIIDKFKNKGYSHEEFIKIKRKAANWTTCPLGIALDIKIDHHYDIKKEYGEDVLYWGGKFARDFSESNIEGTLKTYTKLKDICKHLLETSK